ncbi:MAG TPA: hypothetical protein VIL97_11100, partial [Thermoanaerobaculia bacterium]
ALGWGPHPTTDDLDLAVYDPFGALRATSATLTVPGLFGSQEGLNIREPIAGRWTVKVASKTLALNPIEYVVAYESFVGLYARLATFSSPTDQKAMQLLIRSRALGSSPNVNGNETINRATLARAFVANGQPKFLPSASSFTDLTSDPSRFYPESSAGGKALGGAVLPTGPAFGPKSTVTRLEFVRAAVRFSGLSGEAEARSGELVALSDASALSASDRGYVAVALERGLIDPRNGKLDGASALSSLSLARALYNVK